MILGLVEKGSDPIEERRKGRAVRTFRQVAEEWLTLHVKAKRKGRTGEEYERALRIHILPALGSKRMPDVRRVDVAQLHARIRDKPHQANRTVATISAVWNWAARRDEVAFADSPARGIEPIRKAGANDSSQARNWPGLATPCARAKPLAYPLPLTKLNQTPSTPPSP